MNRPQLITDLKQYFSIKELVCEHVYERHGESAWAFFDPRLLDVLAFIRTNIGKPITINTWKSGGQFSQRGLRCNLCELVKSKKSLYISAHMEGMAIDFDVQGMKADEVRRWLEANKSKLPHNIRLEKDVTWVHLDVRTTSYNKITYF